MDAQPSYRSTPSGIQTVSGTRFRTTEALLYEWAGPVIEQTSLDTLIDRAEVWLRAPATLALWALPLLLLVLPAWVSGVAALSLYAAAALVLPAFPHPGTLAAAAALEKPILQAPFYVIVLSLLGMSGQTPAVLIGLAGFLSWRLELIQRLVRPLLAPLWSRLYPLPMPDQVLRALVVRTALQRNIRLPELERLEQSARKAWSGERGKGKRVRGGE